MSWEQLDNMPLRHFYSYMAYLEAKIASNEKAMAAMNNR